MSFYDDENNESGVLVSHRHASLMVAAGLFVVFFSFISGYFWGQKKASSQFTMKVEQESFADQIYSSMCDLCQVQDEIPPVSSVKNAIDATQEITESADPIVAQVPPKAPQVVEDKTTYIAQLIGFGAKGSAVKFANKLNNQGISVEIRSRKSKSAKGKTISWYQVVTQKYEDKKELERLVAQLSKKERLNGVQIIAC